MSDGKANADPQPDDSDLVERMRAGDRDAAVTFLWNRRGEIMALSRKLVRPDDQTDRDPEDLFSTLLRRVDRIVTLGRFQARDSREASTVVFTLLRRAAANVFRHGRVRRQYLARATPESAAPAPSEPIDRERLRAVFAQLDDASFKLLAAKIRGESSAEIAKQLGTTEDAIRQRWSTLRRRLSKELASDQGDRREDTGPGQGQAA
ncbi:MAG: sigma-70 family RNA polymerase sigma factor [Phycisphaerales bacterium]